MIKHPLVQFLILTIILLAETTITRHFEVLHTAPSIYLVCFIFVAYTQGSVGGVLIGFFLGLVADFISMGPLGVSSFALSLIGYLLSLFRGKIFVDPIFVPMVMGLIASLLHSIISAFLFSVFNIDISLTPFSGPVLVQVALNAFIAPICFGLLKLSGAVPQYVRESF